MEVTNTTKINDCFDLDVNCLNKLTFNTTSQSNNRTHMHEKIVFEQVKSATRRFISACESLNVDCLQSNIFMGLTFLLSRFSVDEHQSWNLFAKFCEITNFKLVEVCNSEAINDIAVTFTNADWRHLLENVELSNDYPHDSLYENNVIRILHQAMQESHLPFPGPSKANVITHFFLHMCPANTPAARMCESYLSAMCSNYDVPIPLDLEIKVMKCLSHFHDHKIETSELQLTHFFILQRLHVRKTFQEAVRFALNERAENLNMFTQNRCRKTRPRLSDYVEQVHKSQNEHGATFMHWTAKQKFGINTSVRMQKVLYFMRVQSDAVPTNLYLKYFSPKVAENIMSSTVDIIDEEPVISCIQTLRTYNHRVENMINFRTICLSALPVSVRSNLKPATVLQLYIGCYQHESIRVACLQTILQKKLSYNLKKSFDEFRKEYPFEIEPVLEALVEAIYALSTRDNSA